jgi:hypothetical protein
MDHKTEERDTIQWPTEKGRIDKGFQNTTQKSSSCPTSSTRRVTVR